MGLARRAAGLARRVLRALRPRGRTLAGLVAIAGCAIIAGGVAMIYLPAGVIAAGLSVLTLGLWPDYEAH